MTKTQLAGGVLLGIGSAGMALAVLRFFAHSASSLGERTPQTRPEPSQGSSSNRPNRGIAWLLLVIILAAGFYLRIDGLDTRSISHPEVYVPGIELPVGISEPPQRTSLVPLAYFHFYGEPHPPAYYFLMYGWTKVLGTSLTAIRLPSLLFGLISILLLFQIGRSLFDDRVALLGASLLALNGHHIYWSQQARMYSMVCFLGLLSVWLMVRYLKSSQASSRRYWALGYVLVAGLGVYTELIFWPLLAGQALFVWLSLIASPGASEADTPAVKYLLYCQTLVIMLGAPMWAHAVMTGRQSPLEPLSIDFVRELLTFGFLFERDIFSDPTREIAALLMTLLAAVSMVCIVAALFVGRSQPGEKRLVTSGGVDDREHRGVLSRSLVAAFSLLAVVGVGLASEERRLQILMTGAVPLIALAGPTILDRASVWIRKRIIVGRSINGILSGRVLLICLFFFPVALMLSASLFNSLIASRVFLALTPYLLLLVSLGAIQLSRNKIIAVLLIPIFVVAHAASINYYRYYPGEAFDYKELAAQINAASRAGDMLLVHNGSWITTPLYYHLNLGQFEVVADDPLTATGGSAVSRVWLVNFEGQPPTDDMLRAVASFHATTAINSRRANAVLYERALANENQTGD